MKKIAIICCIILLGAAAYIIFAYGSGASHDAMMKPYQNAASGGAGSETGLAPSEVTVGVVERGAVTQPMAELLRKRLTALGFVVKDGGDYHSTDADASSRATIIVNEQSPELLALLDRVIFTSNVYRREVNVQPPVEVLFYSWQIKDIQWGDLAEEAAALQPAVAGNADVPVRVLNATGIAGEAGRVAVLIKEKGFTNVEAGNSSAAPEATSVFYQKEYKAIADALVPLLASSGYSAAQIVEAPEGQADAIVIVLVGKL